MEGEEQHRQLGGTAGFPCALLSLSAGKRDSFVPAALISVVGRSPANWAARLILGIVTPHTTQMLPTRSPLDKVIVSVECVSPGKRRLKPSQVLSKYA